MVEVNVYLVDGKKYLEINKIEVNGITYLGLVNKDDDDDFIIRRVDDKDLVIIDSNEELMMVLEKFVE